MTHHIGISLLLLSAALNAEAASFDCAKATTAIEKQVCEHPGLSDLDERLAEAYRAALAETQDGASLRQAQRKWLSSVRNRCEGLDCLVAAYVDRLVELVRPKEKPEEGLGVIAELEWEPYQPVPGLFDMAFCGEFFRALEQNSQAIEVIPPLVTTDDWRHPAMQEHLQGCRKETFTYSEQQNTQKLDEGVYYDWPSGEVLRAIDRFALWPLPFGEDGHRKYLLYTGPRYLWKSMYDDKALGKFFYGGSFRWISQPGCQKSISFSEHSGFADAPAHPRESRLLRYQGSLYVLVVGELSRKYHQRIGSLSKLKPSGKAEGACSAEEKQPQGG